MSQLAIGVVGAGGISRFHFKAYAEVNVRVPIIADANPSNAEKYAHRFKSEVVTDYRKVVAHPDVNVVGVFVPSRLHYEIARAALDHGKHVVCEKTLTLSPAQSMELARLAESRNVCLFTSYMKRFFPAVQKAKELMPTLGHITSVYCRTYQGVGTDMHTGDILGFFKPGADGASGIMKLSGGGILVCGGSHVFDALLFLVGKPKTIFARSLIRPGCDVDFMTHAMMDLDGGGVAHFEGNWHALKKIGYEGKGWDESFEISGTNGRLMLQTPVWDQPENTPATLNYYDNANETWTEFVFPAVNPFVLAEQHFLSQIAMGEQGPMDRYTGYRTDLLLESARQSAASGKMVEIRWEA